MTKNKEQKKPDMQNVSRLKISMILGYAVIVVAAVAFVSMLAVRKTDTVLKNKVSSMVSSLNVQMKLNMNSYLSRMETIGTLAFAAEEAYTYDATNPDNDEYEALNTEKIISDKLYSLCIMENFVDYGIIYRDNSKLGKISNGTLELFGNDMFIDLKAMISRGRTHDGWFAGYKSNYERVYYVKQIHENAILVMSFYTTELEEVFDNPETLNAMTIRLMDKNDKIIFSSEKDELGHPLPDELKAETISSAAGAVMDDNYLITVNDCNVGWDIVCSIPTNVILKEQQENRKSIRIMTIAAAVLAAVAGSMFSFMLSDPITMIAVNIDDEKERKTA